MEIKFKKSVPAPIKAEAVKKLFRQEITPDLTTKEILVLLNHLDNYKRGLRKKLSKSEETAFELLNKIKVAPSTAYRWIRYSIIPEEIIGKINLYSQGKGYTQRRLIEIDQARIRKKRAELALIILEKGRQMIEDLEKMHYKGGV